VSFAAVDARYIVCRTTSFGVHHSRPKTTGPTPHWVLSFAASDAQLLYTAPSLLVCISSVDRRYALTASYLLWLQLGALYRACVYGAGIQRLLANEDARSFLRRGKVRDEVVASISSSYDGCVTISYKDGRDGTIRLLRCGATIKVQEDGDEAPPEIKFFVNLDESMRSGGACSEPTVIQGIFVCF
jgi:hypothetical protein